MAKRKDECYFCKRRICFERIVSFEDFGATYDEVACPDHVRRLEKHSDIIAPGVKKLYISSIGGLKRGEMGAFRTYEK